MNEWFEQQSQHIAYWARQTQARVQKLPVFGELIQAWYAYHRDQGALLAAALAYYALLSVFPLILFVLALLSDFLDSDMAAMRAVMQALNVYLPAGVPMIRTSLQELLRARGALTIAAAGGFIWMASSVFDVIQLGVCRAFGIPRAPSFVRRRFLSLAMVVGASGLFALSFASTTLIRMALAYRMFERGSWTLQLVSSLSALVSGFLVFVILYRYVPVGIQVSWRWIARGALVAAILWEIAKLGFAWYLTNFMSLNLIYGSVGAIIALMLWCYVSAAILIYGGEVAAIPIRGSPE